MRLLLQTFVRISMAGSACIVLLLAAWAILIKTPAPMVHAQTVETRDGAANPEPTADATPRGTTFAPAAGERDSAPISQTVPEVHTEYIEDPQTGQLRPRRVVVRTVWIKDPQTGQLQPRQEERVLPALTAADEQALKLATEIRESKDDAERAELRKQLASALGEAFDKRRERQSEAIEDLAKQLEDLRSLHAQRGDRKDEIVRRRVSELLAEPGPLAWEPGMRPLGQQTAQPMLPTLAEMPVAPEASETDPSSDPSASVSNSDRRVTALPAMTPAAAPASEEQAGSSAGDEKSQLEEAARLLELAAEISELERELASGLTAAREAEAKQRLRLARAKMKLAEIRWDLAKQSIQARVDAANARFESADSGVRAMAALFREGRTTSSEVDRAEAAAKQAAAERRNALGLLRGWEKTNTIVRAQLDALETVTDELPENEGVETEGSEDGSGANGI